MVAAMHRFLSAALMMLALGLPGWSAAAVIASVDRDEVELNESFTLKVIVDSAIETVPDVSALEQDFFVGSTSQLSNTTIVNGQISRSRTWTYMLMAKHEGELTIPPIVVGTEQSDPLRITVSPQADVLPGEADIFVTSEVDHTESFVQAQILYTVKVYRAVATRQPRLSDLSVEGVEVLKELAGEERSYDSILNGKAYNVVERVYALFPQESGELNIAPQGERPAPRRRGHVNGIEPPLVRGEQVHSHVPGEPLESEAPPLTVAARVQARRERPDTDPVRQHPRGELPQDRDPDHDHSHDLHHRHGQDHDHEHVHDDEHEHSHGDHDHEHSHGDHDHEHSHGDHHHEH